jgi:NTE family protein
VTLIEMTSSPCTSLVLAGGGLVGGAWMVGALHAIATETGWDPGGADIVLGTSAGSMIGALLGSAVPAWLLMVYGSGEDPGEHARSAGSPAGRFGAGVRLHWSFPRPLLGSPGLALRSLREPWKYGPAGIIAWLPRGVVSTEPLKSAVRRVVPSGWSSHPNLWITAIDYETGARVVFGREGAPRADLADAVAASCAIPGFYHPVAIRGRRYVDGGMYSPANLDLIAGTQAELVVCLNPVSSHHRGGLLEPTGRIAAFLRGDNRRLIDRETLLLERAGKRVILLEPNADDLQVMGFNYMSRKNVDRVMDTAVRSTTAALQGTEAGRALSMLPAGRPDRLRRPRGSPSSWPADLFPPVLRSAWRQETGWRNTS